MEDCGPWVLVNAEPYPRIVGQSFSYAYTETAVSRRTLYEYKVFAVNAARQQLLTMCEAPCSGYGFASSPRHSAPSARGTLIDSGWTVYVEPCGCCCP